MPINVFVDGVQLLADEAGRWGRAREEFARRLVGESRRFGADAVARAKDKYLSGPRPQKLAAATGRLRSSVTFEVSENGPITSTTVGTNMEYARAWELGRPAGSFPPIEPLARWARLRLGVPEKRARSVGFLIARRIFLEGQEPRPFLAPATHDALPEYEDSIRRIMGEFPFRD